MLPGVVQIQAAVCQLRRIYMDPRPTDCIEGLTNESKLAIGFCSDCVYMFGPVHVFTDADTQILGRITVF